MTSLHACFQSFDPDAFPQAAIAVSLGGSAHDVELPLHTHRKAQLVVALQGGVMCRTQDGLWMAPLGGGVWAPGGTPHSNRVTTNGRVCMLFVEPDVPGLPDRCCTLSLSPMLIEMIRHLARQPTPDYASGGHLDRIAQVILEELRRTEIAALHLPIPASPALRRIAEALIDNPGDRSTVGEWARRVAMSERTLTRLVVRETAMNFSRWRQQLQIVLALQRLSSGASVQSVAYDLGYESASAFITMFKAALGKPPAKYIAAAAPRALEQA
jgi:AraC-like DNA-binding protein